MSEKHTALEPTFADVMTAIADATDLSEQIRRHWRSSVAGIAKAFDQPPELIPARYSAVRARMAALHHVPMDWTAKTLANHKANAKAALIWFAKEKEVLQHGVALSPAWDRLRCPTDRPKHALSVVAVDAVLLRLPHRARGGRGGRHRPLHGSPGADHQPSQRCREPADIGAVVECWNRQDRRLAGRCVSWSRR